MKTVGTLRRYLRSEYVGTKHYRTSQISQCRKQSNLRSNNTRFCQTLVTNFFQWTVNILYIIFSQKLQVNEYLFVASNGFQITCERNSNVKPQTISFLKNIKVIKLQKCTTYHSRQLIDSCWLFISGFSSPLISGTFRASSNDIISPRGQMALRSQLLREVKPSVADSGLQAYFCKLIRCYGHCDCNT